MNIPSPRNPLRSLNFGLPFLLAALTAPVSAELLTVSVDVPDSAEIFTGDALIDQPIFFFGSEIAPTDIESISITYDTSVPTRHQGSGSTYAFYDGAITEVAIRLESGETIRKEPSAFTEHDVVNPGSTITLVSGDPALEQSPDYMSFSATLGDAESAVAVHLRISDPTNTALVDNALTPAADAVFEGEMGLDIIKNLGGPEFSWYFQAESNSGVQFSGGSFGEIGSKDLDFNDDGEMDNLWRNPNTGVTWIQFMKDGEPIGGKVLETEIGKPWLQLAGDMDGDGDPDLVWRNPVTGVMWSQLLEQGEIVGGKVLPMAVGKPWELDLTDLNKDGTTDLLWRNSVTGTTWAQFLDTDLNPVGGRLMDADVAGPWKLQVADMNRDGDPDLIYRNPVSGTVWLRTMQEGTTTGGRVLDVAIPEDWSMRIADLDADGDQDVTAIRDDGLMVEFLMKPALPTVSRTASIEIGKPWQLVDSE